MENKDVLILMSTYNGEKYIEEQIESILCQNHINIFIKIRDDGSNDRTCSILKEYEKYENIEVEYGENIGWQKSFMKLAYESRSYDYYAFADQDDYWKPDKLLRAIKQIEGTDGATFYYSNYTLASESLETIIDSVGLGTPNYMLMSLVQNFALGCTMVINNEMMKIVKNYKINYNFPHDMWIPLLGKYFGNVIYDENPSMLHRIHGNNASDAVDRDLINQFKLRINKHNSSENYYCFAKELLHGYGDRLNEKNKADLELIIDSRVKLSSRIKLSFNPEFRKYTLKGTIFLKILCLFNIPSEGEGVK